ncbi:hypothetical protein GWI33_009756, partial [Rhynchophorus ferrugineus]
IWPVLMDVDAWGWCAPENGEECVECFGNGEDVGVRSRGNLMGSSGVRLIKLKTDG